MLKTCYTLAFALAFNCLSAQLPSTNDLYKTILSQDSLLFQRGFNTCDINQFESLISPDFEFYHDIGGKSDRAKFFSDLKAGLCGAPESYQARRELVAASTEIYPLYQSGVLYGAIQIGIHKFYETQKGKAEVFTSIARFNHLWLLEGATWKLSRSLSFDHIKAGETPQTPKN